MTVSPPDSNGESPLHLLFHNSATMGGSRLPAPKPTHISAHFTIPLDAELVSEYAGGKKGHQLASLWMDEGGVVG